MSKGRLEAFSDGVIAILITIMVLELRAPDQPSLAALRPLIPQFLAYFLSFLFLAIYWNNHHHLFQVVRRVDGRVLWANVHLLFWLSLVPFVTAWTGENGFVSTPVALYGVVLISAAMAYFLLVRSLLRLHPADSPLALAVGKDFKGKLSIVIYALAVLFSLASAVAAWALYVLVALIWLVPDRRIEKVID